MTSKMCIVILITLILGLVAGCSTGSVTQGGRRRAREEGPDVKTGME